LPKLTQHVPIARKWPAPLQSRAVCVVCAFRTSGIAGPYPTRLSRTRSCSSTSITELRYRSVCAATPTHWQRLRERHRRDRAEVVRRCSIRRLKVALLRVVESRRCRCYASGWTQWQIVVFSRPRDPRHAIRALQPGAARPAGDMLAAFNQRRVLTEQPAVPGNGPSLTFPLELKGFLLRAKPKR